MITLFKDFKHVIKNIYQILGIYLFWIFIHYISANIYPYFCASFTFKGLLTSIFMTQTPHCIAIRYLINNGASAITTMWLAMGSWIISKIIINNVQ